MGTISIMIINDDDRDRDIIKARCNFLGSSVRECITPNSWEEASALLDLPRVKDFDLFILDFELTGWGTAKTNGLEIAKSLLREDIRKSKVNIALVTRFPGPKLRQDCAALGIAQWTMQNTFTDLDSLLSERVQFLLKGKP